MAWASRADVERWFTYHAPTEDQVRKLKRIRDAARHLATVILESTPQNADQWSAVRKVREAVMTANAAVVCHKPTPDPGPNAYLGAERPAIDLNWTGSKYTWKCPACDAINYGQSIGTPPAVRDVICERCTGEFRDRER